jgi:hypothetical protein
MVMSVFELPTITILGADLIVAMISLPGSLPFDPTRLYLGPCRLATKTLGQNVVSVFAANPLRLGYDPGLPSHDPLWKA